MLERKKGIFEFQKLGFKYQKPKPEGSEPRFYIINLTGENSLIFSPQRIGFQTAREVEWRRKNGEYLIKV